MIDKEIELLTFDDLYVTYITETFGQHFVFVLFYSILITSIFFVIFLMTYLNYNEF